MKPIRFHPEATTELAGARAFYEARRDRLGDDFLSESDHAVGLLRDHPHLGAPHKRTRFRRLRLRRFPYVVYYLDSPDLIRVIAVAHDSRRPDYWIGRRLN